MKRISLLLCFALFAGAVSAQTPEQLKEGNRDEQNKVVRGPYQTNRFFDNWYIGVAGGINMYFGEDNNHKVTPNAALDVNLGKWFTPSVGIRVGYRGLNAGGWTNVLEGNPYFDGTPTPDKDGYAKSKFGMSYLHGDFMWNISNALGGYKQTRTWSFIPFVGAGWARSYDKNNQGRYNNEWAVSYGLLNNIRLCNALDLTLEVSYMVVNERFDDARRGTRDEGMLSATLGLTYNFNKRAFKRVPAEVVCDYTPYANRIQELEGANGDLTNKNDALAKENEELRNRPSQVDSVSTFSVAPVALFFPIGKSTLDNKELANLDFFVTTAMKADANRTFTIVGSADSATGNAKLNQKLSEDRMNVVYKLLTEKYGIDASRLTKQADGDKNNQFSEPELNRCVIVR